MPLPFQQCRVHREDGGAEHAPALFRKVTAELLAVGQAGGKHREAHFGDHFLVDAVQVVPLPAVHHRPEQIQSLCFRLSGRHQPVAEHRDEFQGTLHDKAVGTQRSEDVVHLRERLYHAVASECSRHVEEHHVGFHVLGGNHTFRIIEGVHRVALDDGIGILLDPAEMVASESLEVGAAVDKPHFVFAQSVDAVLWVVAVHDGDIVASSRCGGSWRRVP